VLLSRARFDLLGLTVDCAAIRATQEVELRRDPPDHRSDRARSSHQGVLAGLGIIFVAARESVVGTSRRSAAAHHHGGNWGRPDANFLKFLELRRHLASVLQ
jgi:hypothetical protein